MPTDELRHARPKWLFRLSLGIWFLLASAVPLAGYMAFVVLIPFGFVDISWSQYSFINYELPAIILPISVLLFASGVFFITSREGNLHRDENQRHRRRDMRFLALALAVPVAVFSDTSLRANILLPRSFVVSFRSQLFSWSLLAALVVLLPMPLKLARYLRDMARRVLDRRMVEHCGIVAAGWLTCIGMLIVYLANIQTHTFSSLTLTYMLFQHLAILMILLFGLWSGFVLVVLAKDFACASRDAKISWKMSDLSVRVEPAKENPPAADHAKA